VRFTYYHFSRNVCLRFLHFLIMLIYKVCIPPNSAKYQQSQLHLALHENYADTPVLKDIVTGDEIVSDTWDMKEVEGAVYEIDCKRVTEGAEQIGQSVSQERGHQRQHEAAVKNIIIITLPLPSRYWGQPIRGRTRGDSRPRNKASN